MAKLKDTTIEKTTTGGQNQIAFKEAGTTKTQITSNYGDNKFYLYHEGDNRMVIDSDGRVGFGTSSPGQKVQVAGNIKVDSSSFASLILDRPTTGSGSVVQFENNNGIIGGIGAFGDDGLQFRTTDGTQMVIDSSNRVGIGTTSPGSTLDVNGDIQANRLYDRNDTSYYLDPASTSNLNDVTLDTLKQNSYYKKTITLSGPAANSGAGRWFVRLWQTSSGATFSGGKIRVGGTWNYASIMGHIEIDYGVYAAASATGLSGSTRFSSGVANAYDNLRIGDIEIVDGYVGFYVWSSNTNSPYVHFDIYCTREPLFTYVAWASNSLPSQRNVEFDEGVEVNGQLSVTGNSLLGNGNGDYTHINDILYVGATDSGDSHIYFGENSGNWYGAHLYWDSSYGFSWNTRNGGTDTTLWDYETNDTSYWNIRRKTNFYGDIVLTGTATTTNQGRMIDFTGFDKEGTTDFSDRAYIQHTTNTGGHSGSVLVISSQNDSTDGIAFQTNGSSQLKHNSNVIWDAGNDGSGSGLDADLLDTYHQTSFLRISANSSSPTNGHFAIGNASSRNFIQSHNSHPLDINPLGNNVILNSGGGNVGIGTTNPLQKLQVNGDITVDRNATGRGATITLANGSEVAGNYSALMFGNVNAHNSYRKGAIAYRTDGAGYGRGDIYFLQRTDANSGNADLTHHAMVIKNNGKVGIGTTTPSVELEVVGNYVSNGYISVSGNLVTKQNLYLNNDNTAADSYVYFGDSASDTAHWMRFTHASQQFTFSDRVVGTAGRLGAIEYNGSDVDKVNFALSGSTLTITTS